MTRLPHRLKRLAGLFVVAVGVLHACNDDPTTAPDVARPNLEVVDGAHNAGNERFFFLPPLVPQPPFGGTFDVTLSPTVEICALEADSCEPIADPYTTETGPGSETVRLNTDEEHYVVNWHTNQFELNAGVTYRVRVLVAGTELGHADVNLVSNGTALKNKDTGEYITLKDGRTLPIKFRIEEGAVFVAGDEGGSFVAEEGAVELVLPPGAIPDGTEIGITVEPLPSDQSTTDAGLVPGAIYEFGPDGTDFEVPVELTISYDGLPLPNDFDESSLFLYTQIGDAWFPVPSIVDFETKTVTGLIDGFSTKALGGPLSAGGQHNCVLTDTGEAYCWGANNLGQLGRGTVTNFEAEPAAVSTGVRFESLSLGQYHSCGLTAAGEAYCWGNNHSGQLGTGDFAEPKTPGALTPVAVSGGHMFTSLSLGGFHTCGVTTTGAAYCWGSNPFGELGAGFSTRTSPYGESTPLAVAGGHTFESLNAGRHSCALTRAGNAYCWGPNQHGQLGNGSFDQVGKPAPVLVGGGHLFESVRLGDYHSCGVTADGDAYCWGRGREGQLGDGIFTLADPWGKAFPVPVVGGHNFASLSLGGHHSCGVTATGHAHCWGYNRYGQLGNGTRDLQTPYGKELPGAVATSLTFESISAGLLHTCAVTGKGEVYCWGYGGLGQLGEGAGTVEPLPVLISGLPPLVTPVDPQPSQLAATGTAYSCTIRTGGETWCWGNNARGQLGNGTNELGIEPTPINNDPGFVSLAGAGHGACGLTAAGQAWCWGAGTTLGSGNGTDRADPTPVANSLTFRSLSGGGGHVCGVTGDDTAYCWGAGPHGELGAGPVNSSLTPRAVEANGLAFAWVTTGLNHTCGLTTTGEAWCWGEDKNGQLGLGAMLPGPDVRFPARAATGLTFRALVAGDFHTCGLTVEDALYCWGGILGMEAGPTVLSTPEAFEHLTGGLGLACGIGRASGLTYCWGSNFLGALGDGTETDRSTPTEIATPIIFGDPSRPDALALGSFQRHTCGIANDGTVYCWGSNSWYELGEGVQINRNAPALVQFPSPFNGQFPAQSFNTISAGKQHACAIDGVTTYCWGANTSSQLGEGTTSARPRPTEVLGGHQFQEIAAANAGTCALKSNREPWCWGAPGILGMSAGASATQPQLVPSAHVDRLWAGDSHVCGLDANTGDAYCWGGTGSGGELGDGKGLFSATPVLVIGNLEFHELSLGATLSCGLTSRGDAYCWGSNSGGQLGTGGASITFKSPQRVRTDVKFESLATGNSHACGIGTDGTTYCWGSTLDNGPATPQAVSTGVLETIASGDAHACGIDNEGNAFCWGRNVFGQLGDGTEFSRSSPTPVATAVQFTALAGGGEFTCGRSAAGHVYCWGANATGQLGIGGESTPKLTPQRNWIPVGVTTHVTDPAKGLITSLPTFPGLLIGQTFGVPDGQSIAFDRSSIGVVAQPNLGQVTAVEPLAGSSGPIIFGLIDPVDAIWAPSIDRLYIAEGLRGRVTARFGLTPSIVAVRTFAAPVRSLAFTRTLVMAALESGEVVSMEPQSLTPVASSFGGSGAAFVQAADDGTAFAINEGGALSHIGSDGFLLRTYPVATGATAVSGSPAWNLAIVTHQAANRTSWVDLTTGVVELITVNFQPKRVEIDDQSGLAFVLTKTSVWMFDIPTRKLLYQVFAANTTGDLALIR